MRFEWQQAELSRRGNASGYFHSRMDEAVTPKARGKIELQNGEGRRHPCDDGGLSVIASVEEPALAGSNHLLLPGNTATKLNDSGSIGLLAQIL